MKASSSIPQLSYSYSCLIGWGFVLSAYQLVSNWQSLFFKWVFIELHCLLNLLHCLVHTRSRYFASGPIRKTCLPAMQSIPHQTICISSIKQLAKPLRLVINTVVTLQSATKMDNSSAFFNYFCPSLKDWVGQLCFTLLETLPFPANLDCVCQETLTHNGWITSTCPLSYYVFSPSPHWFKLWI